MLINKENEKCFAFTTAKEYRSDLSAAHFGKGSVFAGFSCDIDLNKNIKRDYIIFVLFMVERSLKRIKNYNLMYHKRI